MRKEYIIYEFPLDFFSSLEDFMSHFSPSYTLIDSQYDRRVYKNIIYGVYLNFFYFRDKIVFICSTAYDANKSVFEQENIIIYGSATSREHDFDEYRPYYQKTQGYYVPAATLTVGQKLVANYNKDTFMFSLIRYTDLNYDDHYATIDRTKSIFFGDVVKYLNFDGGFFYGGDFVCTYEFYWTYLFMPTKVFVRSGVSCVYDSEYMSGLDLHILNPPPNYSGDFWSYPWIDDIYDDRILANAPQSKIPDSNHVNRFDVMLFARIDDAPNRRKNEKVFDERMGDEIPELYRNNLWAITMKSGYYVPMVCSIDFERTNADGDRKEIKLPTYEPLTSHTNIDPGHTANTLNNISIILHLYFMVMRDPNIINNYSTIGYNDVLNFVNTYNISTNRLINSSYPVRERMYNCFQMGCRRSMFGMKGYSGIAFWVDGVHIPYEQPSVPTPPTPPQPETPPPSEEPVEPSVNPPEEPPEEPVEEPTEEPPYEPQDPEDPPEQPPNLSLLDIPAMVDRRCGGKPILNVYSRVDQVWAYGGDSYFYDDNHVPSRFDGSLIMRESYKNFSSVTFTFCDDGGDHKYTVTWTKAELDAALHDNSVPYFNLFKTDVDIGYGNWFGWWSIIPFTNTTIYGTDPSDLIWVSAGQNCVMIECIGNP